MMHRPCFITMISYDIHMFSDVLLTALGTQQVHNVEPTSIQRWFNVKTLN